MRRVPTATLAARLAALSGALVLAACAVEDSRTAASRAPALPTVAAASPSLPAPGGIVRSGDSFGSMAKQYMPRSGPVAATGASAWVPPAPPPAFVVEGPPPPAGPPAPPLAAVANRQPANAAPSTPASESVRPEAAPQGSPTPAPGSAPNPALRTAGLELFNNFSCGVCHIFADANGGGSIGPSLDRNSRLTREFAIEVIANGSGAMPSFAGQMTDEEIATLADYLVQYSRN